MAIIDGVLEQLTPQSRDQELQQNRAVLQTIEREIENLAQAVALGGPLEPLLVELRERQARKDSVRQAIATHDDVSPRRFDRRAIERQVRRSTSMTGARCCPRNTSRTGGNCCEKCS